MRRTLAGVLFGLLFALSPAYPQTITASAQTTIVVNTTPVTGGSNGQCLTISSGTVGSGACGSGGGLTVGTSTITSGTTTRILYDNAGVLGEYTLTGTGTVAVMQTSPTLITPVLGVATATSVAIGGCTIGSDVLCTSGTATLNGKTTVAGGSFGLSGNISAAAWTTAGIRYANVTATMTDTTSSGTVANAYTDIFGGNTVAASNATTFTNYYGAYIKVPVAGTNVTLTKAWALGSDSIAVNGAGSAAAPSLAMNNFENNTGWYVTAAGKIGLSVGGTLRYDYSITGAGVHTFSGNIVVGNISAGSYTGTGNFALSNNTATIQLRNGGTQLDSPANGSLQQGAVDVDTNAAIVAQIFRTQGALAGGTADQAGKNFTLLVSPGKGTGAGGSFVVQTAPAGSTGTSVNSGTTGLTVDSTQKVTVANLLQHTLIYSAAGTALPTCNGAAEGSRGAVSDALTPTFLTAYVSGGTTHASVYCDGTSWKTD
jgi:hypothetical protein